MAIYSSNGRIFVTPVYARAELDGNLVSGIRVYEVSADEQERLYKALGRVPLAMFFATAVIVYAHIAIESALRAMAFSLVMFLPLLLYFYALYVSTTFPRTVVIDGLRLKLLTTEGSISFCVANIAAFVPLIYIVIQTYFMLMMARHLDTGNSSLGLIVLVSASGLIVLAVMFSLNQLRLVVRARERVSR